MAFVISQNDLAIAPRGSPGHTLGRSMPSVVEQAVGDRHLLERAAGPAQQDGGLPGGHHRRLQHEPATVAGDLEVEAGCRRARPGRGEHPDGPGLEAQRRHRGVADLHVEPAGAVDEVPPVGGTAPTSRPLRRPARPGAP